MWGSRYSENRKNTGNYILKQYKEGNAEQEVLNIYHEIFAILYTLLLLI